MSRGDRPKTGRITRSGDIRSLRRTGRFFRGDNVSIWVLVEGRTGEDPPPPLLGVVTGRGFRGAVERNRARRRVKGCLNQLENILEPGGSYLVECRPGSEKVDYQNLVTEIESILSRT